LTEPAAPDPGTIGQRPSTFSLEGRAAPALYLIGWVGSVMGLAVLLVSFLAGTAPAAPWLFLVGLVLLVVGLLSATGSQAIEGRRWTDRPYHGPSPVLAFGAVIAVTLIANVAVIAPLVVVGLDPLSPAATAVSLFVTMLAYIGVVRLAVVGPGALSWPDMQVRRPDAAAVRDLAVGAMLALPVLVVTLVLGAVLARFLEPAPSPLPETTDGLGLLFNLVAAAVLAPIGEELFFRGFTTTAWARVFGPRQAIVRGAIFFGIAHVLTLFDASFATGAQRALFSFLTLLPVGLALGWVFVSRRSLYAAIGLHATFNGIQVVLLFLALRTLGS
jgi:membrane protease YdiL (CAAX protease family)